ncbi:MAG TPA: DNA internalization-related competence protein ComEC/Rec2 [Candidatus Manganitrophaceae bacterium]|nr:DNA internalization-related competence protein ComEC/Rec2 [Candidatus Manganitrophaceae bacterium]
MGKRPLVALTLSFLAGLISGEIFSYFPFTLTFFLFALLFFESILKQGRLLSPLLFLFGAAGFVVCQIVSTPFSSEDLRNHVDRGPIRIIAQIDGPLHHRPEQVVLEMKGIALLSDLPAGLPREVSGRFRLTIYAAEIPFEYGDRLEMEVRLRRPQQFQNPGVFQHADYREREGWSGVASLARPGAAKKVGEGGNRLLKALYRSRETIRKNILSSMDGPPAALLLAMIIGESGYLTDPVRDSFSAAGVTHILSISGSHLAFVSLLTFGLIRWLALRLPSPLLLRLSLWKTPSQWGALFAAASVTFYAFLAGGEIATLRSLAMIWVYLFSIWIGRTGDAKITLSLAALLILAVQPQAIFDLSFQLSYLSVLSIILTIEWSKRDEKAPEEETPSPVKKYLVAPGRLMVLSTLGATVGTAPLTLYYFHQFSWIGPAANFVLIPFAGLLMVPFGLGASLLSLLLENRLPLPEWSQWLWSLYYQSASFFADFPGAGLHFASPPLWAIFFFYGMIFSLLLLKISWKGVVPSAALFLLFFLGWGSLRLPPEKIRITFLDVGQGDSTLIEFPGGKTMLVDGGSAGRLDMGRAAVAPYLWERKIRKIDYLVGTHPQLDHMGGFSYIVRHFNVGEVWTNGATRNLPFYSSFLIALEQKGLAPRAINAETPPLEVDGCRIFFLNPPQDLPADESDLNNHSIVMRLSCPSFGKEGITLLLTGDIEEKAERAILEKSFPLKSAFLKVPHHGSASSLDAAFLSAVSPEVALVSVGRSNPYRHPHPRALAAYEAIGAKIRRTDEEGALIIEADRNQRRVRSFRELKLRKIRWMGSLFKQELENVKKAFSAL